MSWVQKQVRGDAFVERVVGSLSDDVIGTS